LLQAKMLGEEPLQFPRGSLPLSLTSLIDELECFDHESSSGLFNQSPASMPN